MRDICGVYLTGDPSPIIVDLSLDALLARISDFSVFADANNVEFEQAFLRIPLLTGQEGLIRPCAITAVLPRTFDPDAYE